MNRLPVTCRPTLRQQRLPSLSLATLVALLSLSLISCEVDRDFVTGDAVQLRFSLDTLSFDTVFAARGSATRSFKVYNDANDPVRIDRIAVAGETGVDFTFNVDGFRGPEANDVIIWAKDSIFVFVEVEVDPTDPEEVSPFIAEDRLIFETGNVQESVALEAFGQNALYLNGFNRSQFFQPICQGGTFTLPNDLPTVIYGSMVVDSCTLRALAGTRIYFHGGVQRNEAIIGGNGIFIDGILFTGSAGRLEFVGTAEEPIVLASDRLEEGLRESRGAYRGIILGAESRDNRLEHVEIRNAVVGITADSLSEVTLESVVIENTSSSAISTYQSEVTARNSLFYANLGNTVQYLKGGSLLLEHCTLANYGADAAALALVNFICDDDDNCLAAPLDATVRNSILAGSRNNELLLVDGFEGNEPGAFEIEIRNSVVKTDQDFLDAAGGQFADFYGEQCRDCYNLAGNSDPLFVDVGGDDYSLDSLSVARDLGAPLPSLLLDIDESTRDPATPDAGALEWQPGQ